jgi:hypothetical protein
MFQLSNYKKQDDPHYGSFSQTSKINTLRPISDVVSSMPTSANFSVGCTLVSAAAVLPVFGE